MAEDKNLQADFDKLVEAGSRISAIFDQMPMQCVWEAVEHFKAVYGEIMQNKKTGFDSPEPKYIPGRKVHPVLHEAALKIRGEDV